MPPKLRHGFFSTRVGSCSAAATAEGEELRVWVAEEVGQRHTKAPGEPCCGSDARVPLGPLNAADVSHVQLGEFGKAFLREPALDASAAKVAGEDFQGVHDLRNAIDGQAIGLGLISPIASVDEQSRT
jgi:hypothetical protein